MMLLDQAIVAIRKLPPQEQDALARELLERIAADEKWELLLADPRTASVLSRLWAEAKEDVAQGEFHEGDPSDIAP